MEQIPREVAWLVSFVLIEAAIIDGRSLRVPNWLTYNFLAGGLIFAFWKGGSSLLLMSAAGRSRGSINPSSPVRDRRNGGRRRETDGRRRGLDRPMAHVMGVCVDGDRGSLDSRRHDRHSGRLYRHLAMMHTIGPRGAVDPESSGPGRAGRDAQADDDAVALRHPDRDRLDCELCLDWIVNLVIIMF